MPPAAAPLIIPASCGQSCEMSGPLESIRPATMNTGLASVDIPCLAARVRTETKTSSRVSNSMRLMLAVLCRWRRYSHPGPVNGIGVRVWALGRLQGRHQLHTGSHSEGALHCPLSHSVQVLESSKRYITTFRSLIRSHAIQPASHGFNEYIAQILQGWS